MGVSENDFFSMMIVDIFFFFFFFGGGGGGVILKLDWIRGDYCAFCLRSMYRTGTFFAGC